MQRFINHLEGLGIPIYAVEDTGNNIISIETRGLTEPEGQTAIESFLKEINYRAPSSDNWILTKIGINWILTKIGINWILTKIGII